MHKSVEITLPLSPRHCLFLNRRGRRGFVECAAEGVETVNRLTRFGCHEHFVSDKNRTNPFWFEPGVEPEDSWRKTHGGEPPDEPTLHE